MDFLVCVLCCFFSKCADMFFISPETNILWVLIRSIYQGTSNEYCNICFHGEIKKIFD